MIFFVVELGPTDLQHIHCLGGLMGFYLFIYFFQIAFADHQKNMVKLEGISEKCTGLKKYDWYDNLKGETLTFV